MTEVCIYLYVNTYCVYTIRVYIYICIYIYIARQGGAPAKDPPNSPNLCKKSHILLSQSPTVPYNILFKAVYEYHPKDLQIKTGSRHPTPHYIKNLPVRQTYIFTIQYYEKYVVSSLAIQFSIFVSISSL